MALFMVFLVTSSVAFVFGAAWGSTITRVRVARELRETRLDITPAVARYRRQR